MLDVFIPSFGRPQNLAKVVANLHQTTVHPVHPVLILERTDTESIEAASRITNRTTLVGDFRSYSNAINTAYFMTTGDYFITSLDDLEFTPGWDVPLFKILDSRPEVQAAMSSMDGVFNSLAVIRRSYLQRESLVSGMPNLVLYPYHHHESDREMYWTLKNRGVLVECPESIVHHRHESDTTEKKTKSMDEFDLQTYWGRRHLFRGA